MVGAGPENPRVGSSILPLATTSETPLKNLSFSCPYWRVLMATYRKRNNKWQVRIQRQNYPSIAKTFIYREYGSNLKYILPLMLNN